MTNRITAIPNPGVRIAHSLVEDKDFRMVMGFVRHNLGYVNAQGQTVVRAIVQSAEFIAGGLRFDPIRKVVLRRGAKTGFSRLLSLDMCQLQPLAMAVVGLQDAPAINRPINIACSLLAKATGHDTEPKDAPFDALILYVCGGILILPGNDFELQAILDGRRRRGDEGQIITIAHVLTSEGESSHEKIAACATLADSEVILRELLFEQEGLADLPITRETSPRVI